MELQNALLMSLRNDTSFSTVDQETSVENIQLVANMMQVSEARAAQALVDNGHNVEAAINSLLG